MKIKRFAAVVAVLLFIVLACVIPQLDSNNAIPPQTSYTATMEDTEIPLTSTFTVVPTPTNVPTATPTPEPTAVLRYWTEDELRYFLAAGNLPGGTFSSLLLDGAYPGYQEIPQFPFLKEEALLLLNEGKFSIVLEAVENWILLILETPVSADTVCAWGYTGVITGYGWYDYVELGKNRQELIEDLQEKVGNPNNEPYCSEFDLSNAHIYFP